MLRNLVLSAALAGIALSAPATEEDCSKSEVPHSPQCLTSWFLEAGCQSLYAASPNNEWKNETDIDQIQQEMAELYQNATAEDADPLYYRRCLPLTEQQKSNEECYEAIANNCTDCFLGSSQILINQTCAVECVNNSTELKKKCPTFVQTVECDAVIKETCSECGFPGAFGKERFDSSCFEDCYKNNREAIQSACPLPDWLSDLVTCAQDLNSTCGDCYEEDDEAECVLNCWNENQAKLNQTCPESIGDITAFIVQVEDDVEDFLKDLANKVQNDFDSVEDVLSAASQNRPDSGNAGQSAQDAINDAINNLVAFLNGIFGGNVSSTDVPDNTTTEIIHITVAEPTATDLPSGIPSELPAQIQNILAGILGQVATTTTTTTASPTSLPTPIESIIGSIFPLGGDLPTETSETETPTETEATTETTTDTETETATETTTDTETETATETTTDTETETATEAATTTN